MNRQSVDSKDAKSVTISGMLILVGVVDRAKSIVEILRHPNAKNAIGTNVIFAVPVVHLVHLPRVRIFGKRQPTPAAPDPAGAPLPPR